MVHATNWGVAIAFDSTRSHDNARKWASIRQRATGTQPRGLTGDALEVAVRNIGTLFPGHVIHEGAAA